MKTTITAPAVALLLACTSAPSTTSTSASSSGAGGTTASSSVGVGGAAQDAGPDVEQPLPDPDAAPVCLENPGITCVIYDAGPGDAPDSCPWVDPSCGFFFRCRFDDESQKFGCKKFVPPDAGTARPPDTPR